MEEPSPALHDLAAAAGHYIEYVSLLGGIGSFVVRRVGRMRPRIAWADPPMATFFAAAAAGALLLLVLQFNGLVAVRAGAEAVAFGMCVRGLRLTAVPAVFAAAVLPLTGHAAAVQPAPFGAEFADIVHVLSAALWAGGVIALLTVRPPEGWRSAEARLLLERFGRVAFIALGITVLTGLLIASEHIAAVSDLWSTPYGTVLALKCAGVLVMMGLSLLWRRGVAIQSLDAVAVAGVTIATAVLAVLTPPA